MKTDRFQDDTLLLRSCIGRDHEAWEYFIRKYSPLINASIACRVRKFGVYPSVDEVGEIRQCVLSRLWEGGKLADIRDPSSMKYWLAAFSGNTAVKYMRKRMSAHRMVPASLSDMVGDSVLADILPSDTATPAEELDKRKIAEDLNRALETLSEKERIALSLSVLHGKKHEDIAAIIGIPPGSVSHCLKGAKNTLRKMLRNNV